MTSGESFSGQTVEDARRLLTARLKAGDVESPELDVRLLTGAVLGVDLTGLIAAGARRMTLEEAAQLDGFAHRRVAGEPVARIIGVKEFWSLPLLISPETLVPRPDTETIVEAALDLLRSGSASNRALRIADLGTGSGAILLALLSELPDAVGFGTDISEPALQTARVNARRLGLAQRAAFVACDYAAALCGPFDLIVSNPPYIRSAEIGALSREVRDHDPHRALDGGADGFDAYRRIVPEAALLLASGGALIVESGLGQSSIVGDLMTGSGLITTPSPRTDLAGIERAVIGRKLRG